MKNKPVFKNTTKGRIQIIQQGIPIWLNPGDIIVGERFRAFLKLGLEEVGRDHLPQPVGAAQATVQPVNDPAPEKSPVKLRKLKIVDTILPNDEIRIDADATLTLEDATTHTAGLHPEVEPVKEEVTAAPAPEELTEAPEEEPVVEEEPVLGIELLSHGEALKDEIIADLTDDMDDDEPLVILDDDDEEVELEKPDDHPFKCDQCDRGFASSRGLKSHKRSHRYSDDKKKKKK